MVKVLERTIKKTKNGNLLEYESGIYLNDYGKYEIFYENVIEDEDTYCEGTDLLKLLNCNTWPKWEHDTYEEALEEYNKFEDKYL